MKIRKNEKPGKGKSKKETFFNILGILIFGFVSVIAFSCSNYKYTGLMKWENYTRQDRHKPYILELNIGKGALLYYGAFHSIDLSNPQFKNIEEKWKEFQPDVAFSEGGIWPLENSRMESIKKHGEQGLLRFLAVRDNVSLKSIEPKRSREVYFLGKYFIPSKIKIYYVLRQVAINQMLKKDKNDLKLMRCILADLSDLLLPNSKMPPNSLADFEIWVHKLLPSIKDWKSLSPSWFCSKHPDNWLTKIHRKVNDFRNQYFIRKLIHEVSSGKKVFALVGRSHVVMQEPVLRSELENNLPGT